jgi:hypothetical protein
MMWDSGMPNHAGPNIFQDLQPKFIVRLVTASALTQERELPVTDIVKKSISLIKTERDAPPHNHIYITNLDWLVYHSFSTGLL